MWVVDASVYIAAATESDRNHERARIWLEESAAGSLVAPNLLLTELAASVRRLTSSRRAAERAVAELRDDGLVELVPLTRERGLQAAEVAAMTGVRGADSVYLALARELDASLITLDRQQLERGKMVATVRRP